MEMEGSSDTAPIRYTVEGAQCGHEAAIKAKTPHGSLSFECGASSSLALLCKSMPLPVQIKPRNIVIEVNRSISKGLCAHHG
jgi:hypothetical protein